MKRKEKIKKIALRIVDLEKEHKFEEMEKVVSTLTLDEMLEIDEYITEQKLLTK